MMPHNSHADHIYTHPVTAAQLYLGSVTAAQDPDHLSTLSVRHVVTVMWAPPPTPPLQEDLGVDLGVERHHVRIRDANDEHMSPFFDEASATIEGWLGAGKNTMIHCSSGVSRSATIAIGYLISKGHSLVDAFGAVHAARPVICPGTTFFGDLRQLEQTATKKTPSMTLVQYYGYTVQANAGAGVAYDVCVAAVERFGYANDYALMQAIAHAAESAKGAERADAKREEGAFSPPMADAPPPPLLSLFKALSKSSDDLVNAATPLGDEGKSEDRTDDSTSGVGADQIDLATLAAAPDPTPWLTLKDAMADVCPANPAAFAPFDKAPAEGYADPAAMRHLALQAQLTIEATRELVFGPDDLLASASCFNWALGGGELGFNEGSWPEVRGTSDESLHLRPFVVPL